MERHTSESVACQLVAADRVAGDATRTGSIGKQACARATNFHPVARGDILGHGIAVNSIVRSKWG